MIEARDISLSFGERALLRNVSFQLNDRGRICLAGPNGTGKSTLFSILMGELQPDSGQVIRSGGTRMGILRQHAEFQKAETPFTAARMAFAPLLEKARVVDEFHHAMGVRELSDEEMHRLDVLQDALVREGYYSVDAEVRAVLSGLGFGSEAQDRPLAEFSGGWNMRVALAQLLLSKPDCLLLDEPTNHLDLESIVWLEEYLRAYPGSMILVCHDRRFVDQVCESVMEIRQGRLETYSLPFVRYEEERALRTALQMKAAAKAQDEIERLTLFIDRFKAKASKASLARSAMKKLDRVEVVEVDRETAGLRLRFPTLEYMGSIAYQVEDLAKSYGEKKVFEKGSFTIEPGDKVALVGPNGAGKSTLMRLLVGEEDPSSGDLRRGGNLKAGYYAQYVEPTEKELKTPILDILRDAFPEARDGQARSALGAMLFSGDDALKPLKVLSGGERARVRLARLLLAPGNTLLLDEPTNHLDLRSKDLLLEALGDYPGTVVFVSHDRDFCEALATRVVKVEGGRIVEYPGDFAYYLHKVEQDTRTAQKAPGKPAKLNAGNPAKEAEKRVEPGKKKQEKRESSVAERITALEKRVLAIDEEMCREEIFTDGEAMRKLTGEKNSIASELEIVYAEWMSAAGGEKA